MKVVCEGCQAKYRLTDGRLTGRTLKFRCRKCGNIIMIDGAESRAPLSHPPAMFDSPLADDGFGHDGASAYGASSGVDWYVSINGEPYGPSTTEQMASLLCDGQLPWDTYVWREGYPEWKAASESRTLVASAEALLAQTPLGAVDDTGENPALGFSDWQDEAAAELAGHGGFPPDDYIPRRAASGYGRSGLGPSAEPKTGFEPEMSALLDMRTLSALTGGTRATSARAAGGTYGDARLSLAGPRGAPGHADTLAPVDHAKRPIARAVPFAILSGSALIAAATFLTLYSSSAPSGRAAATLVVHPADSVPVASADHDGRGVRGHSAGAASVTTNGRAIASAEPASSPATAASAAEPQVDEVSDDVVPHRDHDLGPTLASRASTVDPLRRNPVATGLLPDTPSRTDVVGAMRAIEPDVRMCVQGQRVGDATASASFTVAGSTGRVGNVRVSGVQGAVSECIARAVRSAMFPPFAKGQLRINFPVRLSP